MASTIQTTQALREGQLSPEEEEALKRGGLGVTPEALGEGEDPVESTVRAFRSIMAHGYDVKQVARLLQVDTSRIHQRLKDRTLYGVRSGREWILPAFQFDEAGEVPNIAQVLPCLHTALHPVEVVEWFMRPDPDLVLKGRETSPRDWLRSGGAPQPVIALAGTV